MILVDLDSLYKAEDKEEIHFNKYFAFRNKCTALQITGQ